VYWRWSELRRHERSWKWIWNRVRPLVDDLGDLPAAKLTPERWEEHRARERLRGIGEHTLNVSLWRAKEMLTWAVENKHLKFNPLGGAKAVATVSRRETWLPLADVDKLVAAAPRVKDARGGRAEDGTRAQMLPAFVLCAHDSLLRFNEVRSLRWDRIADDGRVELASSETKGAKRRTIFLTPRALKALKAVPRGDSPYVFSRAGNRISETTMHLWFRRLCKLAGVDGRAAPGDGHVRPHDLRASGATTADEQGARATAIRDAMGHSSISTTAVYLRSAQATNARAVASVLTVAARKGPRCALRNEENNKRK
jgi:integrase